MLHLETRVHFKEVEALIGARRHEFHGAGAVIVHGLGQGHGLFAHLLAGFRVEQRRWRFLDDFLIAALDRAFALNEVDTIAMLVAKHLDLDMARLKNELLDKDTVVPEGRFRLGLHGREALFDFLVIGRDPDALAAPARGRLDHDRITDFLGNLHRFLGVFDQTHMAWHGRHAGLGSQLLGADLVAHRFNGVGVRADPTDPLFFKPFGEHRVFGQETEARMDRLCTGLANRINDLVGNQIRF